MKAVLKNGAILPQEPLPPEWREGLELHVEEWRPETSNRAGDLTDWIAKVQASADKMDPEDERIIEETTRELRRKDRELARKVAESP